MKKNNNVDVVFLCPPGQGTMFYNFRFFHNLGASYVSAYLNSKGFNSVIYTSEKQISLNQCVNDIINHQPSILGFTTQDTNYTQCLLIAAAIKKAMPSIIIVFGGPSATTSHERILENKDCVDVCVRGEGEEVFHSLTLALSENNYNIEKTDLESIAGISFKRNGRVVINPASNILFNNRNDIHYLDNYPSPHLSGVIPVNIADHIGIVTARGCNQNCVFCNCAVLYNRKVYKHSIDRVIEELSYFHDHKSELTRHITFHDDAFTLFPKRAARICQAILDNKIELDLNCCTRCDLITKELLDLMKEAGFFTIAFALESASPKVLRAIGKVSPAEDEPSDDLEREKRYLEKLREMTSYAKEIGLHVRISAMIGLPGETPEEARSTIDFLNKLDFSVYSHHLFVINDGTPIQKNYRKYGYETKRLSESHLTPFVSHYPFNVAEIKNAKLCKRKIIANNNLRENMTVLGLTSARNEREPFFRSVIIRSDIIQPTLAKWFGANLAFNGKIIQLYSSVDAFKKHHFQNLATLYDCNSPSLRMNSYYCSKHQGADNMIINPFPKPYEDSVTPLNFFSTDYALNQIHELGEDCSLTLCVENNDKDARRLPDLFMKFLDPADFSEHLMDSPAYPKFTNLCRWSTDGANCQTWETAIIDKDGGVSLCWNGEPIGGIPDNFETLERNLEERRLNLLEERGCAGCSANERCCKCYFPNPLKVDEFCAYQRRDDLPRKVGQLKRSYKMQKQFALIKEYAGP